MTVGKCGRCSSASRFAFLLARALAKRGSFAYLTRAQSIILANSYGQMTCGIESHVLFLSGSGFMRVPRVMTKELALTKIKKSRFFLFFIFFRTVIRFYQIYPKILC